jgi:predicted MFS family arabinose efflux permease
LGGGYMIADLGYRAFFLTGVTLTLVGVAILAAYFRVPRGEYEKTDI